MATNQNNSTRTKAGASPTRKKSTKETYEGNTSSTRKNTSSTRNNTSRKTKEPEDPLDGMYHDEITLIASLMVSILLILSNFNLCGNFGIVVNRLLFGIFGFLAYFVPFLLFIGIAFHISNRGNKVARRKLTSIISLFIVLTTFLQLLAVKNSSSMKLSELYKTSSENKSGGGILGGIFCKIFVPLFGVLGTYVILIAIMFVLVMFITEKGFFASLGKKGGSTLRNFKEKRRLYKESREEQELADNYEKENVGVQEASATNDVMPKRQAKIFTLKKPSIENELDEPDIANTQPLSSKKSKHKFWKNKEETIHTQKKPDADMEEVIPSDIDNIPIHRAVNKNNTDVFDMKNMPIYEEELRKKFTKSGNDYDIKQLANKELKDNRTVKSDRTKDDLFLHNVDDETTNHYLEQNLNNYPDETIPHYLDNTFHSNTDSNLDNNTELYMNHNNDTKSGWNNKDDEDILVETTDRLKQAVNDELMEQYPAETSYMNNDQVSDLQENVLHENDLQKNNSQANNFNEKNFQYKNDQENNSQQKNSREFNSQEKNLNENLAKETILEGNNINNNSSFNSNPMKDLIKDYKFPPIDLLAKPKANAKGMSDRELKETALKLQKTLESFGVGVTITNVSCGPAVTRYELQPEQGVKVSKITNLADDIKLNLAAADIRIEAPIPGKAAVGIEVPNKENTAVMFRELIETPEFKKHPSSISFAVGKDIGGQTIVTDIAKMPHLLIAGATGSGKSVCINTIIMSILYKANPNDVKLIMVDPKVVELSVYNGIPHLLIPVVTDPKKASAALNWAVMEMTERYNKFAELGVRDIKGYNEKVAAVEHLQDEKYQKMPQIVIIVDELADLMMVAPGEVEDAICRLAQMARAAGLHLIIATQRPSVNVITGLIKANVPSRIAFSVSSAIDSRTIIDGSGAEKLLGKGDMLFFPSGYPKPVRIQGAFVSDKEVSAVVDYLTAQNNNPEYNMEVADKITNVQSAGTNTSSSANDRDEYFIEAGKFIIDKDKASIGMLQRVFKIGFNRAARIMDQLSDAGVVGPEEGTKPRKVLMSIEEFEEYVDEYV